MTGVTPGDFVLPFLLERPELRGRLLRAGDAVQAILSRHDYPDPVARQLGELLVLAGLLSSLLKFDGVCTLQIRGQAAIRLMVVDVTSAGHLRGYAEFNGDRLDRLRRSEGRDSRLSMQQLLGPGQLVFTVDLGGGRPAHQAIVELSGETLTDSLHHYFRQSEQLSTATAVAVCAVGDGGWRASGLLLQQLPENETAGASLGSDEEDDWRRALVLMASCSNRELLDFDLEANDLLFRLFHEEQVRVFAQREISFRCRCSRERIETTLRALAQDDLDSLRAEGEAVVTCQFCNTIYRFDGDELASVVA